MHDLGRRSHRPSGRTRGRGRRGRAFRGAARARPCPRRPRTGAGRTSRSTATTSKPASLEQGAPVVGREPGEAHGRLAAAPRTRSVRTRRSRSQSRALPDPRLALEPAAVRLLDVVAARREDVEDEPAARRRAAWHARERARAAPRRSPGGGSARNGQVTSRDPLVHRRVAQVAEAQVEQSATPAASARRAADLEHPGRRVDADHRDAASAIGTAIRPVPTPSSTTGPPRLARLLDVEGDVLGDAAAPRVVELGDRVVGARHEHPMIRSADGRPGRWKPRREARSRAPRPADELDEARVRYLGRKSELKQALREVRDRETGQRAQRAPRGGSRTRSAERQAELERAELDRRLDRRASSTSRCRASAAPRGHLHLITQIRREVEDVFLGLGYQIVDGREVETTHYNFDALNFPPGTRRGRRCTSLFLDGDVLLRTETSPSQIRVMEAQPPPVYMVSLGRVYRRDTPDATHTPDLPPGRGPRRRPRHHARRPQGHAAPPHARALRRGARGALPRRTTSRSPSRRSSPTSRASSATARAAASASTRAGSRWAAPAWSTRTLFEFVGLRPRGVVGLRVRPRPRADRHAPPRPPRHPAALGERPAVPAAVLTMKVPVSWLREYVDLRRRRCSELADRLAISTVRGRAVVRRGVADDGRQPRPLPGRPRGRGGQAPERRPAPALPRRRGRGRAAPDRLRRLELRRGRDRRGRAARARCSRTAGRSSGRSSAARSPTG